LFIARSASSFTSEILSSSSYTPHIGQGVWLGSGIGVPF